MSVPTWLSRAMDVVSARGRRGDPPRGVGLTSDHAKAHVQLLERYTLERKTLCAPTHRHGWPLQCRNQSASAGPPPPAAAAAAGRTVRLAAAAEPNSGATLRQRKRPSTHPPPLAAARLRPSHQEVGGLEVRVHNALAMDGVHCLLKRMEGGRWRVRHCWLGGGAVFLLGEAFIDVACL